METLKRCLLAAVLTTCAAVVHADTAAIDHLVRQAQFWEERGRNDLARDTWARLLEADQDHLPALERLLDLETRLGNPQQAARYAARLRALAPGSEALERHADGLPGRSNRETVLEHARSLARAGRADEAVAVYQPLLNADGEPPGDIAVEYYENLAGTETGWTTARTALANMHTARPQDLRVALLYARMLSYRASTRRHSIQRLADLAEQAPPVRTEARAALRQALIWLDANAADRPLYDAYLAGGDDPEIRQKLEQLRTGVRLQQQATADARRAEALRAGYAALDADDLEGAESFFTARLNTQPSEADSLAGLGLVRLRQQRFADAETLLSRAGSARPALRSSLAAALNESRYWRRIIEARSAQQRGDWPRASAQFASALQQRVDTDADVRRDYAAVLRELNEPARAERVLRDGLQRQPGEPLLVGALADLLLQQGRDSEIDALLASAPQSDTVALRGVRVALLRARAARAVDAGNPRTAEALLQQALATDAQSPWVRLDLARLYRNIGRVAEADSLLQALTESPPGEASDALLAQAYALTDAQRWYETLLVLDKLPPAARNTETIGLQRRVWINYQLQRAEQAAALREPGQAIEYLNAAINAADDGPEHAGAIARGWRALGDPARAVAALRRAFAQRSPTPGESVQYASLLLELNQDTEFEAVSTALIQANAMSPVQRAQLENMVVGYRIKLADRMRERGEIAPAYTQLREVVLRHPEQPRVQSALARLFIAAGDTDKALAIGRALMRDAADDPVTQANAIDAALAANHRDDASQWIEQARQNWPEDPAFLRAAARLAEQRGNRAQSLRLLRSAAELEEHVQRDSALPELALISDDGESHRALPQPVYELLRQDGGESIGPLLPRAGDSSQRHIVPAAPHSRMDSGFGAHRPATQAPLNSMRAPPVQLQLDRGSANVWPGGSVVAQRSSAPTAAEDMQRLEASIGSWTAASFASRSRRGESGLSRLLALEMPLDVASRESEIGRFGLRITPVMLDAGEVSGTRNKLRFGTLALINGESDDLDQSANGLGVSLSYRIGELDADIGTTPLGFEVENLIGGLRWQTRPSGNVQVAAEFSRRPVTDSFLSYAGTLDPLTGHTWGGVLRTGARLDFAYDLDRYGLYVNGAWYDLGGRNVEENTMLELGGGMFFRVLRDLRGGDLTLGINLTSFGYEDNLRHFTFGHGGYFSPQMFITAALPLTWTGRYDRLDYRIEAALGIQSFREDGAPLFPGRASLQDELEAIVDFEPTSDILTGYPSQKNSGLAYKFGATLQYRVNPRLSVGGLLSLDNARDYEEALMHLYLRFHFSERNDTPGSIFLPRLSRGALP